jgi:hypothetical protein
MIAVKEEVHDKVERLMRHDLGWETIVILGFDHHLQNFVLRLAYLLLRILVNYLSSMGKSQKKKAMRRHNPMRVPDSHLSPGLAAAAESSRKKEQIFPILQKVLFTTSL